jgi:putative DNA primase/helicase
LLFVEGTGWHHFDAKRWLYDPRQADHYAQEIGCQIREEAIDYIRTASIHELTQSERDAAHHKAEKLMGWAKASESSNRIEAILKRAQCHMFATAVSMDADPWVLNCANGTLNLRSGILHPANPDDRITKMASVAYDPNAPCPLWEKSVLDICCNDTSLMGYLQRVLGYALTGDISEQTMFVFNGTGANGKDTVLGRVIKAMGDYSGLAAPTLLIESKHDRHPTEIADLMGIRMCIASETGDQGKLNETLVKQFTGSEHLKGRHMRQDFFTFKNQSKIILMTNHKPIISGTDYAIWRRLQLMPFNQRYVKGKNRDDTLWAKLDQKELPGILRWCVEGCLAWQRIGLQPPEAVRRATQEYRQDQDILGDFFDECCTFKRTNQVTAKAFYARYVKWCDSAGERPKSQKWLWPRLQERGIGKDLLTDGYVYRGVGLNQ